MAVLAAAIALFFATSVEAQTPEVIHQGGGARGFDVMMPAFGDESQHAPAARHGEGVSRKRSPGHGDARRGMKKLSGEFLHERRVGRRGQYDVLASSSSEVITVSRASQDRR
jgi:hypothetical protein